MGFLSKLTSGFSGKKTATTITTGFLQGDIEKFLKQGFNLSANGFAAPTNPQQATRTETKTTRKIGNNFVNNAIAGTAALLTFGASLAATSAGSGSFTGTKSTSFTGVDPNSFSGLSQERVDAFITAFAARSASISQRTRAPGRERLFIRE